MSGSSGVSTISVVSTSSYNIAPVLGCVGAKIAMGADIGGIICTCCCALLIFFAGSRGAHSPKGGLSGMTIFIYVIAACCLSGTVNYAVSYFNHKAYLSSASCVAVRLSTSS